MPNPIKYTAGTETLALNKGNFYIGTGDVGKGSSDVTGYYQGPSPALGGYVVYLNKSGVPGNLSYHSAANDNQLISFTNNLSGTSFTSATQCLNYYATQTDKVCFNIDYPPIVTDGLIFNLDAGFTPSYSRSGTTWYDVSVNTNNGTLVNGPTFSTLGGGSINFDGSADYAETSSNDAFGTGDFTLDVWFKTDGSQTNNAALLCIANGASSSNWQLSFQSNILGFLSNLATLNSTYTPNDTWTDATIVRESNVLKIYINAELDAIGSDSLNYTDTSGYRIGMDRGSSAFFKGGILNVKSYNRALSPEEIQNNYTQILSRIYIQDYIQRVIADFGSFRSGFQEPLQEIFPSIENSLLATTVDAEKEGKLYSIIPQDGTGDFTVSRNGTATYFNQNGELVTASANEPRLSFNPSTLEYQGVLIERAATNILLESENFLLSPWAVDTNGVRTTENIITPLGTVGPVTKFTKTAAVNSTSAIRINISSTADKLYFSIFLKKIDTDYVARLLGFATSVFPSFGFSENSISGPTDFIFSSNVKSLPNDWWWVEWGFVNIYNNGEGQNVDIVNFFSAPSNSSMYLWGAQIVENYPSSYIPTTTSQVTRPADIISVTGSTSLFGQTQGTILFSFETTEIISLTLGDLIFRSNGGVSVPNLAQQNSLTKVAYTYSSSEQKLYQNGLLIDSITGSFSYGTLDSLFLGSNLSGSDHFGPLFIQEYSTYDSVFSEQTCIQLTTL
jgi:hypothetical protein